MSSKAAVIERLKALTGPDHEVDAQVAKAMGMAVAGVPMNGGRFNYHAEGDDVVGISKMCNTPLPLYTESIDAALTLVPPRFIVASFHNGDLDRKYLDVREHTVWSVTLARKGFVVKEPSDVLTFPTGKSPMAAVALCIAALQAAS